MTITRIIEGLNRSAATGAEAQTAARLGFLEWAFTGLEPATVEAAQAALRGTAVQDASSAAARAFVGYLRDATQPICQPARRRGRATRLH